MLWKKLRKIPKNNGVIGHRKCPEIRKGARQKWFKFRALGFDVTFMIAWREQKQVCPAWREIEPATSILDTTLSSQVGSIVCCAAVWLATWHSQMDSKKVRLFLFSVSCFDEEVIFFIFWGLFREKQNHTITEECPDCCLAKHEGNQMSGLGEDTFPKSKSRPPCSWPVNGGACLIAFVSGQFVVDSGFIAATSQQGLAWEGECLQDELQAVPGEKKERRTTRRRSIFRTMRFGAFSFRPRTSKKGSKSWSTPVCDCLEKETKTVILSDNSNEPELRARSDEATTTRCRKEKLLRLRQRGTCSAVVVDRSPCTSGQPFPRVTCVLLAGGLATWPGRETYQFLVALCTPTVDLRVHMTR